MPPLETVIMKHFGEPALAAVFAAIIFCLSSLIGLAFLSYGVQTELSRWMSDGAAAILVGLVLIAGSIFLIARNPAAAVVAQEPSQEQSKPHTAGSLITSNLNEVARTLVFGIFARRPIATLALAAFTGAVVLVLSTEEKDTKPVNGRINA